MVKGAEFEEFVAIEGTGSASAVEARIGAGYLFIDAVPYAQPAVFPPTLGKPRFFADFGGIAEEDLAGHGEDVRIGKAIEQWLEKAGFHSHVAIE